MATPRVKKNPSLRRKPSATSRDKATPPVEILKAAEDMLNLKREKAVIESQIKDAQTQIMSYLDAQGKDATLETESGKFSVVRPTSVVTDEAKLKKALGASMWNKITTRVLDSNKLKAFVKTGEIESRTVAAASHIEDRTPYVKATPK